MNYFFAGVSHQVRFAESQALDYETTVSKLEAHCPFPPTANGYLVGLTLNVPGWNPYAEHKGPRYPAPTLPCNSIVQFPFASTRKPIQFPKKPSTRPPCAFGNGLNALQIWQQSGTALLG